MKRAIGIFLIAQAVFTYLTINMTYTPYTTTTVNDNTGAVTVSYSYPWVYWLGFIGLGIMLIVGTYLVFAKEKKQIFN
ncbi:hypothetical protein ACFW1J_10120 [Priestia aryabhattai]|uniref:hypothetical protein n=1 Tax=Priestia aryabhattai TaxID=412384 RepID=UPI0008DC76A4|nr:hypothetical protein [Priestia aryabhattai]MBX9968107.1 hypothetical protein [Priestia aryabhattai]MBZ6486276.1 hypothetical protein [Priestia aryabhattai]MDH3131929.1 hypothetical protein [Priestia aryabhattai]MED4152443.1 hypothetical protein [Priestia aryabhattai]OHY75122.1 hypothetical protein BCV52_10165 [Priestia aryabhattai]